MKITNHLDALLIDYRAGDEGALKSLQKHFASHRNAYINAALVDVVYTFSEAEREHTYQATLAKAIEDFCFQLECRFLSYFILELHYAFCNLAKTKSEFAASISYGVNKGNSALLRDCSQKDNNDLMETLFTWRGDIMNLAANSGKFCERDLRICNKRLDNMPFAQIAEEEGCSLSTCNKAWKKFIDYARKILKVPAKAY